MARKKNGLLDLLMTLPWWVSVVISAVVYFALTVLLTAVELQSPALKGLQTVLPGFATLVALLLLVPAPISAFNSWRKRGLLDAQRDIASIRELPWREFEELVGEAYRRQGYQVMENTRGGADGGVDIRLKKNGALHLIQCKNWRSQKIGVAIVRELYGVMTAENAHASSVVCSGMFTQEARNFAAGKNIDLVDGPQLASMIGQVQLQKSNNEETHSPTVPADSECPRCGSELVRRVARKGKNAGNEFYGCAGFPNCRYTSAV